MQTTRNILMIRPVNFRFNEQTAENNKFQKASDLQDQVHEQALKEFDQFVEVLRSNGVNVTVIDDTPQPETPDSIFPNNWVSFHDDGTVYLYPMFSVNRRHERRGDVISTLSTRFQIKDVGDLSNFEAKHMFLEGTGSMVLDRDHKIAYACLSLRTNEAVLHEFCVQSGYTAVVFSALDAGGFPIYHTNVMMCVGDTFAVICLEAIPDPAQRALVAQRLRDTGKALIEIDFQQMGSFAGNMLQVRNEAGESLLVMSEQAFKSLSQDQVSVLEQHARLVYSPLYTIEQNGGGSARCMLAEIHLPLAQR
ncbi:citrulline utilization hydrolase CtlX [Pedobacter deserti]|uniref:citrulline utilization hydrolase CtlX n=1 Tax=Pedobacter deserti TaxID=2817382 RepID=UPI00210EE51E|nr:arginine deiminase-related protein [Pedobacter sp. SYSU D00382]